MSDEFKDFTTLMCVRCGVRRDVDGHAHVAARCECGSRYSYITHEGTPEDWAEIEKAWDCTKRTCGAGMVKEHMQ